MSAFPVFVYGKLMKLDAILVRYQDIPAKGDPSHVGASGLIHSHNLIAD